MPKFATYQPNTPISSGTLNFSTETGGVVLKTGIPTEIDEEQIEYLEKYNEEWSVCIRQGLIRIEEKEVIQSELSETKVLVTGETPQEIQPDKESESNLTEEPPELQPEIDTIVKSSTSKRK